MDLSTDKSGNNRANPILRVQPLKHGMNFHRRGMKLAHDQVDFVGPGAAPLDTGQKQKYDPTDMKICDRGYSTSQKQERTVGEMIRLRLSMTFSNGVC